MSHCRRGKRKHLAPSDCWSLSNSREGASSLTQPFTCTGTSRDLNRGLYPRNRNDKKSATQLCPHQRQWPHNANRMSEGEPCDSGKAIAVPSSSKVDLIFDPEDFLSHDLSAEIDVLALNSKSNREHSVLMLGCPNKIDDSGWGGCAKRPTLEDAPLTLQRNTMRDWVEGEELEVDPLPDSCFGLLGCTRSHALPAGHITQLPDEILRAIFFHLPAVDLYRIRLVCQQWRCVISDPTFVPWKKLYCRYRKGEGCAVKEIDRILKANNITKEDELCVLNLINYMASFQHGRSVNPEAVLSCLKDHPLFKQSEACVAQRLPNLVKAAGTLNVWAVLSVIILLSDSVKDIQRLISCLRQPRSTLPVTEITETLYCMATLLFASREKDINISNRIHYNLFYALYLMENPADVSRKHVKHLCSAQDSGRLEMLDIKLTPEQQNILNHESAPGHVIRIMGFAGTGKTSTLIKYAQSRPRLRFLYTISSKPVPVEISRIFPPNVECTTMHAMAYQCIGYKYQRKKKLTIYGLKPFAIFRLPEGRGSFFRANLISQSLCTFFSSMDETITAAHVPEHYRNTYGNTRPMEYQEKLKLVEDAKRIWRKMVDLGETKETGYFMTHDGYLKLWQLGKPSLSQFDVILLDEAEDCSPAIMDIVLSQKCEKILVGDPHQQIQSFKGSIDALFEAHRPHLFSLTQSFRFGPEIAYIAATILDVCKHVKDKTLVGGNQDGDTKDDPVGQVAILCRTNAAVFDEAVRIITSETPRKIYIIGGLDKFGMGTILDIWMLMILEKEQATNLLIRDPFIRIFERKGGLRGLKDYAAEAEDKELEERIAVVEKYGLGLPVLVEKITNYSVDYPAFANIVLGTVHKAKGYEFETVQITDDLVKVPDFRHNRRIPSGFRMDMVPDVDWNLVYIAVTRGKRCLVTNRSLECLLSFAGEYLLKPDLTTSLFGEGILPICHVGGCSNRIVSEAVLTMRKAPSIHSVGGAAGGEGTCGPLCCVCVKQRIDPMTYLIASPELVGSVGYSRENGPRPSNHPLLPLCRRYFTVSLAGNHVYARIYRGVRQSYAVAAGATARKFPTIILKTSIKSP
ncbi:F-box DNA helicase 1 isoform X2 [Heptranchias perlo]|uniref:F-box DNA helicase 1 isoform X2 n=1 Tax=Heptranchias perlo TaxID=212740 RepID=UPI00355A6841